MPDYGVESCGELERLPRRELVRIYNELTGRGRKDFRSKAEGARLILAELAARQVAQRVREWEEARNVGRKKLFQVRVRETHTLVYTVEAVDEEDAKANIERDPRPVVEEALVDEILEAKEFTP